MPYMIDVCQWSVVSGQLWAAGEKNRSFATDHWLLTTDQLIKNPGLGWPGLNGFRWLPAVRHSLTSNSASIASSSAGLGGVSPPGAASAVPAAPAAPAPWVAS